MSVCCVVGGQFGSEGKGLIVGEIAREYKHHVRVGAANAGHTIYTTDPDDRNCDCNVPAMEGAGQHSPGCACFEWEKHVMQQLPCAAYANPDASLYIGAGAQISHDIFDAEIERLKAWRTERGMETLPRIYVDSRAHVIQEEHIEREQASGLAERIGSTSTIAKEGIGAAQAARVMREDSCATAEQMYGDDDPRESGLVITKEIPDALNDFSGVLLEGTQGTGLSLTTGFFPYTTSRNTTAAGLCADVGLAPGRLAKEAGGRVILVCRSYPIRVAGPSGPFYRGSEEITWDQIGVDSENERTTVTKKVRRVATFSTAQVVEAAKINGATEIALTFADYLDPVLAGNTGQRGDVALENAPKVMSLIRQVEDRTGVPVTFVGTGPHSVIRR